MDPKKSYHVEPMWEIPCAGVLFNEIAGVNSRPATLAKKVLNQGGLPVNILELSALLQERLVRAPLF